MIKQEPLDSKIIDQYRDQDVGAWPFPRMQRTNTFEVTDRADFERVRALAQIASERDGWLFTCYLTSDGALMVMCVRCGDESLPESGARRAAAEAPAGGCILVLDAEQVSARQAAGLPLYPLRELLPGQHFIVKDPLRHHSARIAASKMAGATGMKFKSTLLANRDLMIARVDNGTGVTVPAGGRRGRPALGLAGATGRCIATLPAGSQYPFGELAVGDWFTVENPGAGFRVTCSNAAARLGINISCRSDGGVIHALRTN